MTELYIAADKAFIDYRPSRLPGVPGLWRGPLPPTLERGRYGVAIGAAQTFGRFVEQPYPALLAEQIGFPVLNLGIGGGGPANFDGRPLMTVINNAAFCVVQCMSARAITNDFFNAGTGENAFGLDPDRIGRSMFGEAVANHVLAQGDDALTAQFVHALRRAWISQMYWLSRRITVPTVLLWFSKRDMNYTPGTKDIDALAGMFPHYVDRHTYCAAAVHYRHRVEVVTRRGSPHPVLQDGKPVVLDVGGGRKTSVNRYYPSPEMHADAAFALAGVCEDLAKHRAGSDGTTTIYARHGIVRRPVKADEVRPNFLVIGAAKSGTSALARQLGAHPDIYIPAAKELHFFNREAREALDADYPAWIRYLTFFDGAARFPLRGEATVSYTMLPVTRNIPQRVLSHLGRIPLIYIVRDPLDRLVSHYRHALRDNRDLPPFETWLGLEDTRKVAVDRTDYGMQLAPFIETFGEERILVLFHEDYVADHMAVLRRAFRFLGADPARGEAIRNAIVNRTAEQIPRPEITDAARAFVQQNLGEQARAFLRRHGRPESLWPSVAPPARPQPAAAEAAAPARRTRATTRAR